MKLLSVNMEGVTHLERIKHLLTTEKADTVCLQEAPDTFATELHRLGYTTSFAPMILREQLGQEFQEGVLIASIHPFTAKHSYYYQAQPSMVLFKATDKHSTVSHPVLVATISTPTDGTVTVASTHVMVPPAGVEDEHQRRGVTALLNQLSTEPPHILCGDFNMPRGHNNLYQEVTKRYTDVVPDHYKSSLDRHLHRLGADPTLNRPIFDEFMVDYIFTQPPYQAQNVRLQFGVSDHAAVIANITKK